MRLVTTCTEEEFRQHGHRLLESFKHVKGAELWWYADGFSLPKTPGVVEISADKLQALQAFRGRMSKYLTPSLEFDVLQYAPRIFAVCDALGDYKGIGGWISPRLRAVQDIPAHFLEGELRNAFIARLTRKGATSQDALWLMDCAHEQCASFVQTLGDWLESRSFTELPAWTDMDIVDATVRRFEKHGLIESASMSGIHEGLQNPLIATDLGQYLC